MFVYISVNVPRSYENYANSATLMKHLILLLCLILFGSCSSTPNPVLAEIASVIEDYPDSALMLLRRIDYSNTKSDKVKAKYSLLYAMALDKNYIDICSDSIIRPALDYYSNRGVYDDRMKAYYYRGVVGRNKGNSEEAMSYYVIAESLVKKCRDYNAVGRLYNAMMNVYIELYDYESAYQCAAEASCAYMKADNLPRYYDALLDMLNAVSILGTDNNAVDTCIRVIQENWNNLSEEQRGRYYFMSSFLENDDSMPTGLSDRYDCDIDEALKDWIVIAMQCYKDENHIGFREALVKFAESCPADAVEDPIYLLLTSLLMEHEGRYQESLEMLREAVAILDAGDMNIFKGDTKFLAERYKASVKKKRLKNLIIFLISSIIFIILSGFAVIQSYKRKKIESENEVLKYQVLYRDALLEQERLKKSRKDTALGKNVRKLVNERLEVLNKFILANISDTFSKKASAELRNLMSDREHFLESTHQSFIIAHPQFLMFLKSFNLSAKEIGYCCLYCIGLNGSEIASYLERKSIYNVSYAIRKKMKLDRSTNLDTYLRAKMQELDKVDSTF